MCYIKLQKLLVNLDTFRHHFMWLPRSKLCNSKVAGFGNFDIIKVTTNNSFKHFQCWQLLESRKIAKNGNFGLLEVVNIGNFGCLKLPILAILGFQKLPILASLGCQFWQLLGCPIVAINGL